MRPVLRAYIPSRVMPVVTISKVDSLLWDLNPTLSDHDVVNEASQHTGFTLVNQLVPHWKSVERIYFDGGNPDMRDAAVSLREFRCVKETGRKPAAYGRTYTIH